MSKVNKKISVIGAGKMGLRIAQLFSRYHFQVTLIDTNSIILDKVKTEITMQLNLLRKHGFISESESETAINNIFTSDNIEDAKDSFIIIEAVPEIKELKINLFRKLEAICDPKVIFATNTSGISINSIGKELRYANRLIGTHFFMPADVIPLVEIIKSEKTADVVIEKVMSLFQRVGKRPVLIKKDIPGFIGNRIQHAMAREAISLLEEGVASAEDIDEIIRYSIGLRLLFTGPLEQRDINGLDVHHDIASYLYKELENSSEPASMLTDYVKKGKIGLQSGEGFYDWSSKDMAEVLERKNLELLDVLKFIDK